LAGCARNFPETWNLLQGQKTEETLLRDDQIAILCEISQSIAFADDKQGQVENLIVEGYVMKDGDLYELTPKGATAVEEHAVTLVGQTNAGALKAPRL
jgi:hypothetical protein